MYAKPTAIHADLVFEGKQFATTRHKVLYGGHGRANGHN